MGWQRLVPGAGLLWNLSAFGVQAAGCLAKDGGLAGNFGGKASVFHWFGGSIGRKRKFWLELPVV